MEMCEELIDFESADVPARIAETFSKVPLFARLTAEQLAAVAARARLKTYAPRETIFQQESSGTALFVVMTGKVLLIRRLPEGPARLIGTKEGGASFGEMPFITGEQRTLTALAGAHGAETAVLMRDDFDLVIRRDPQIGFTVLRDALSGFGERMAWLPPIFRNWITWGYRPPRESLAEGPGPQSRLAKVPFLSLGGAMFGLFASVSLSMTLPVVKPDLWRLVEPIGRHVALSLVLTGALAGGVAGAIWEYAEDAWRRRQKHPRSCANCRFVVWNESSRTPDCIYRVDGMLHVSFQPGREHDTFTDCPSFDSSLPDERAARTVVSASTAPAS